MLKYFELNKKEKLKPVGRGKFRVLDSYRRKGKLSKIQSLKFHLGAQENMQFQPKESSRKEKKSEQKPMKLIKGKPKRKISQFSNWFFEINDWQVKKKKKKKKKENTNDSYRK